MGPERERGAWVGSGSPLYNQGMLNRRGFLAAVVAPFMPRKVEQARRVQGWAGGLWQVNYPMAEARKRQALRQLAAG